MVIAWFGVAVAIGVPLSQRLGWTGGWSVAAVVLAAAGIGVFVSICFMLNWILESRRLPNISGWKELEHPTPLQGGTARTRAGELKTAEGDIGLDAEIIAIGPFTASLAPMLEYAADYYKSVREGAIIVTHVFEATTSRQSYELAEAFGVDAMDFNRHQLDPQAANLEALQTLFDEGAVERFVALRERGFAFYYRPNA